MAAVKKESVSKKEELKLTRKAVRSGLLDVRKFFFNKVVVVEREYVLMILMGMFSRLRYEDLEEVYNDGCLVLWEKMKDKELNLKEKSMVGYLISICRNIGMHYLRKVNDDVVSLDRIMERGCEVGDDDDSVMEEMFDVIDEGGSENEIFERLDKVWSKLKDVDRLILESYYVNGCRMEEIAKIIGFKNGNSVKSKKNIVLKKMRVMMEEIRKEEEEWEKKRKEEEEKERKRKEEEEKEKKIKEEKKRIREEKKRIREEKKKRREEEKEEKMRIKEEKMKKKEKVDEKVKMKENEKVKEIVEMMEMTLAIAV